RSSLRAFGPAFFLSPNPGNKGQGCWNPRTGFDWTPRPVDRGSLFARSGPLRGPDRRSAPGARVDARHAAQAIHALPALTHAQNIHVLLYAIPGRQDTAHCDGGCDASVRDFSKATPVNWRCRAGPGLRKAAHGCAAAASQPWVSADA